MSLSSLSTVFLAGSGPQVHLTSPGSAVTQINTIATQLKQAGGVNLTTEGQLEQQLVKAITGANSSANQGEIASIAADLNGATGTQAQADIDALVRMVQPTTTVAQLTSTVNTLAGYLRAPAGSSSSQTNTPAPINGTVAATATAGATSITVVSASGMTAGDSLLITLDSGSVFYDSISAINNNVLSLSLPLPVNPASTQVSNGNSIIDTPGITTYHSTLSATAAAGTSTISLSTAAGISIGDSLQLLLDNGVLFTSQVTQVSTATNTVTLSASVPSQASTGNDAMIRANPFTQVNQLAAGSSTGSNVVTYFSSLANNQVAGDTQLVLSTVGGMAVGDTVQITLDSGATFTTTINGISTSTNTISIGQGLPSAASAGNALQDNVTTIPTSTTGFTPSALMSAIFTLQLENLITGVNPTVNLTQLQKDVAALSKASLTALQFQQALTTLNQLWQTGLSPTANFSLTA